MLYGMIHSARVIFWPFGILSSGYLMRNAERVVRSIAWLLYSFVAVAVPAQVSRGASAEMAAIWLQSSSVITMVRACAVAADVARTASAPTACSVGFHPRA